MKLVEIRDLDGPNLFLPMPAVKLEFATGTSTGDPTRTSQILERLRWLGLADDDGLESDVSLGESLIEAVQLIHVRAGAVRPECVWRAIETPGHFALAFEWERRGFALAVAQRIADCVVSERSDHAIDWAELSALLITPAPSGDAPEWVRDTERRVPIVGITGTNGKTTTTRLISHVLRESGRSVGWSSSSGVYINGELVLEGDYTGPSGARRVLRESDLDVAVLETARGGILLRGIAYESNDVSVFTNISPDHLDLLGVQTVEGLLEVKSIVVRVTKASGFVVLNADDPLVRSLAPTIRATLVFVSKDAGNVTVANHVAAGGIAIVRRDGALTLLRHGQETVVARVVDIPVSYGGRATHMVENALCAAGACIALGLTPEEIGAGLASFRNTPELNPGRLHVYDVAGTTIVIDYAHNEAGLGQLLRFGKTYLGASGRLVSVIGTAGDRSDDALREIGRLAGSESDSVVIKETTKYLRGRESAAGMTLLLIEGVELTPNIPYVIQGTELGGVEAALEGRSPGDVVVVMCIEQPDEVRDLLKNAGTLVS